VLEQLRTFYFLNIHLIVIPTTPSPFFRVTALVKHTIGELSASLAHKSLYLPVSNRCYFTRPVLQYNGGATEITDCKDNISYLTVNYLTSLSVRSSYLS